MKNLIVAACVAALTATAFDAASAQLAEGKRRIHPVAASRAMVVTQERHATEVGLAVLRRGGNAVDAAVAVGFALAVTLPRAGNIGGGGFMVIHDAARGENLTIDYRERAPASAFRDQYLDADGNADPAKSRFSGLAVGVPGTVAGLHKAFSAHGSGTLTFAELIAPAIALARDGFEVSADLSQTLSPSTVRERLKADAAAAAVFYGEDGAPPAPGEILRQPDLATTLETIARDGPAGFYTGDVAAAIVEEVNGAGGAMTLDDLAGYEAVERAPVTGSFEGYTIVSMPPPSSGGVHLIEILNMLETLPIAEWGLNSALSIHFIAEAARRAYADRARYLGDPDFVDVPVAELTSKAYAARIRQAITPDRATPSESVSASLDLPHESNETTHFSIVDADGNAVANTYTLNFSFGAGFMADGTGVLLNNELDDFSAKPGVPNAFGLIGAEANAVEANKRPLSSMTPTIVLDGNGDVFLVTGTPGGSRIITTTLQIILNVIVHKLDIATATITPRVHHQWLPDEIRVEQGLSRDTLRLLEVMGHTVAERSAMGAVQSIMRTEDGALEGASDTRRPDGLAAGY